MDRTRYAKAPPLRRRIASALGVALLAAAFASSGNAHEFVVDFLLLAALNSTFVVAWARWDQRDRRFGFERVWLSVTFVGTLAFFAMLVVAGVEVPLALLVSVGPTLVIVLIWLVASRLLARH